MGYTAIAFNRIVQKKIDPKSQVNKLDPFTGTAQETKWYYILETAHYRFGRGQREGVWSGESLFRYVSLKKSQPLPDKRKHIPGPAVRHYSFDTNDLSNFLPCLPNAFSSVAADRTHNFTTTYTPASPFPPQAHSGENGNQEWRGIRNYLCWSTWWGR